MKKVLLLIMLFSVSTLVAQVLPRFEVKHLDTVNSPYSDFGVSYYGDQVTFASSKKGQTSNKKWYKNRQPYLELYTGNIGQDGEIVNADYFSKEINTKYHESNACFTDDLGTVYFSRNNYYKKRFGKDKSGMNLIQMYRATVGENGEWTDIQPMPFNSDQYQTGHPALNKDETKLYFTSDMPGSLGSKDIWVVDILGDGTYGEPVNLGTNINTAGTEMFPHISDKDRLFYSSDKAGGSGGLDVYSANLIEGNSFSEATNLEAPLNSNRDDFSFIIDEETSTGYFSSNRSGGKGDDDIYFFREARPEEPVIDAPCYQIADGVVREKKSGALLPQALVVLYDGAGNKLESTIVGSDAAFSFRIPCEQSFRVVGSKELYSQDEKTFVSTAEAELNLAIDLTMKLEELFIQENGVTKIKIDPIYFDLDKSYIRRDAAEVLDHVVRVMNEYPNMVVQGGSHTDSRNTHAYNWDLSNRRAASTLKYIIDHGIDRRRITATGHGETQLTNRCSNGVRCLEAEHQLNRRTEFIVIRLE